MIKVTMVFETVIAKCIKCMLISHPIKLEVEVFKVFEIIFSIFKKVESVVYIYQKIHMSPSTLKTPRSGEGTSQ